MKNILKQLSICTTVLIFTACGGGGGESSEDTSTQTTGDGTTTGGGTSIIHNGYTYGTVISPYTNKVWLDRNLGAAQVCESYNDTACYGDYYQWGRNADGHEDSMSPVTRTLAKNINNAGNKFIISKTSYLFDWVDEKVDRDGSLRALNWSKVDGSSVCPIGFRVPTLAELKIELLDEGSANIQGSLDAFKSFLKLPTAGTRNARKATVSGGSSVYLWTNTRDPAISYGDSEYVYAIEEGHLSSSKSLRRGHGLSIRCIKH